MSYKIRYRLLSLNARLLQNMLAVIGLAGFLTACSGGDKKEKPANDVAEKPEIKINQDSLDKAKHDSLLQLKEDSIRNAAQYNVRPTITKYGVPDDFNEPQATKYGVRPDFRNQQ